MAKSPGLRVAIAGMRFGASFVPIYRRLGPLASTQVAGQSSVCIL